MHIIPVIDIRHGMVVSAFKGQRSMYQPLRSVLCQSSKPAAVVTALLNLFPFETLYIADLDGIEGRDEQWSMLARLACDFPTLEFWVDAGVRSMQDLKRWQGLEGIQPVIGTESLSVNEPFHWIFSSPRTILSLDYINNELLGPEGIITESICWPERIIVMALDRIGSMEGPNLAVIAKIQALAPDRLIFAAGGVRQADDLDALREQKVAGTLVASALHTGTISRRVISGYNTIAQN